MGRKPKNCPQKCRKHTLALKPVHYSAYFSHEISLCFCHNGLNPKLLIPKFNKDKKHFTSAFILPLDQKSEETCEVQHEKFYIQQISEKPNIMIPKPRSKHKYCYVCKDGYEDYLIHINSQNHKECIRNCNFDSSIHDLCDFMEIKNMTSSLSCLSDSQLVDESKELMGVNVNENKNSLIEVTYKNISQFKFFNDIAVSTKSFQYLSNDYKNIANLDNPLIIPSILKQTFQNNSNLTKCILKTTSIDTDQSPKKARIQRSIILNTNNMIFID